MRYKSANAVKQSCLFVKWIMWPEGNGIRYGSAKTQQRRDPRPQVEINRVCVPFTTVVWLLRLYTLQCLKWIVHTSVTHVNLCHYRQSCRLFYSDDPVKILRARGQYLFDENGTRYLDCISNVQHGIVFSFQSVLDNNCCLLTCVMTILCVVSHSRPLPPQHY